MNWFESTKPLNWLNSIFSKALSDLTSHTPDDKRLRLSTPKRIKSAVELCINGFHNFASLAQLTRLEICMKTFWRRPSSWNENCFQLGVLKSFHPHFLVAFHTNFLLLRVISYKLFPQLLSQTKIFLRISNEKFILMLMESYGRWRERDASGAARNRKQDVLGSLSGWERFKWTSDIHGTRFESCVQLCMTSVSFMKKGRDGICMKSPWNMLQRPPSAAEMLNKKNVARKWSGSLNLRIKFQRVP